jgi:alkanesulfonate monooxygenase SsuD/methylene tetrahydromethanopterin reductase-like flavin-dependent oxidoreductase (luciferase family)
MEQATAELDAYLGRRGVDVSALDEDTLTRLRSRQIHGDPDTVGEKMAEFKALGVDGFTINMPANGHIPGRVALLGATVAPIVE